MAKGRKVQEGRTLSQGTVYKNLSTLQATLDSIIMVGDFNTVLNTSMDRKGNHTTNYHPQAVKEIMNVMDILELVDIWRLKFPDLVRYIWRRLNQVSRLDYFLMPFIQNVVGSSHNWHIYYSCRISTWARKLEIESKPTR